jgi:hypothetical protein
MAVDHEGTQQFVTMVSATPKQQLWGAINSWCIGYFPAVAWACPFYAGEFVALGMVTSNQMSQTDEGHGVRITFVTADIRKFGVVPQHQ